MMQHCLTWLKFTSISHLIKNGGVRPTIFSCNKLIDAYAKNGSSDAARKLFDEMPERNVFTWNTMISGCLRNGNLNGARSLFDSSPIKDSVTYNVMISGYANEAYDTEATELFDQMRSGSVLIDEFTLTTMLNVTARLCDVNYGRQLHALVIKTGNDFDGFGLSSLIDMYSKCGCFFDAYAVYQGFVGMGVLDMVTKNAMVAACCREGKIYTALDLFRDVHDIHDVISWNTLISGCAQNGHARTALELVVEMAENAIQMNEHTMVGVLMACSDLKSLKLGKETHAWILKNRFDSNPFIISSIVDLYCKCSELNYAKHVHLQICKENVYSTTSMIVAYSKHGNMDEARKLFDSLNERNSVVWTAMLNGYVDSRQCNEVFYIFRDAATRSDPITSDRLVLIAVLGACAMEANLDQGKQVHSHFVRMGTFMEEKTGSALVDMYAKCGNIVYAEAIFRQVPHKDRVLYNALIAGFAHNGREMEAFALFEKLLKSCLEPDAATFIALLSACRHAGLAESGEKYFNSMTEKYGIFHERDHYSLMIDIFGRANQLDKAVTLIKSIPFEPDAIIWGTFLNACKMNKDTKLAREVEGKLLEMESTNGARYVQLANAFASKGEWIEVERIRRKMRGGLVKKLAGCSWLQVEKRVNVFTSRDSFHIEGTKIYEMLAVLYEQMMDGKIFTA